MRRSLQALFALALVALLAGPAAARPDGNVDAPGEVRSANVTHVANVKYPDAKRKAARLKIGDWQGGTDLEFATIPVPTPEGGTEQRDFAFAGTYQNGLQVVDITDARTPQLVATYPCDILQGDVQTFQRDGRHYLTYAIDTGAKASPCFSDIGVAPKVGTLIIDVTDPYNPRSVSFASIPKGTHNMTVHPAGEYMYNSDNDANAQLEVWDIRNLLAPKLAYTLPVTQLSHDAHDITFSADGRRAYVASITHTYILDTTTVAQPKLIGAIVDPAVSIHHQADPVTIDTPLGKRTFVIINDEVAGAAGNGVCPGGGLHVYDITGDLEKAPVKVGAFYIPEVHLNEGADTGTEGLVNTCTAHVFRIYPEEGLLTIAWFAAGVRVIDLKQLAGVSAGANNVSTGQVAGMREIGFHRFSQDSDVWAAKVYKFDEDGSAYIFANDQTRGFDVLRYDAKAAAAADAGEWLTPRQAAARSAALRKQPGAVSLDRPYCALRNATI